MCVICASPAGVRQPSISEIKNMFYTNPHGAGYMFASEGEVHLHKGFMDLSDFLFAIEQERFTSQDAVVYHFRISTQAGVNAEMTQPFPLSNQLETMKALDVICKCGVAHNGIIPLTSDPTEQEYSDTALFVADYLSRYIEKPSDLRKESLLNLIQQIIQSKMAILDASGHIATIGEFYNDCGLLFSNLYHRWSAPKFSYTTKPRRTRQIAPYFADV